MSGKVRTVAALGVLLAAALAAWLFRDGDETLHPARTGTIADATTRETPARAVRPGVAPSPSATRRRSQSGRDADVGETVTGLVCDAATRDPIVGAKIGVSESESGAPGRQTTTSDVAGAFSVTLPPGDGWFLVAAAEGYVTGLIKATGPGRIEFRMKSALERTLTVRGADGTAVAGAVVASCADDPSVGTSAISDFAGVVRIALVLPGTIEVSAEGFASRRLGVKIVADVPDPIVLRRPSPVAGVVIDAAGRPVVGARISSEWPATPQTTGADGRFEFRDVDPENWQVSLKIECRGFVSRMQAATPGTLDVLVRLSRPCTIEGTVLAADGTLLEEGGVDAGHVEEFVRDGVFRLQNVESGEHIVNAWSDGDGPRAEGQVSVRLADGETLRGVTIQLIEAPRSFVVARLVGPDNAAATFSGTYPHTGRPGPGGVAVMPFDDPPGTQTQAQFTGIRVGDVDYGHVMFKATTRATPDGVPDVVTLPVLREFTVVVLPDGDAPLPKRLTVSLSPVGDVRLFVETRARTREAGTHTFRVFTGEAYKVHVQTAGNVDVLRELTREELAAGRAEVRLSAGATVRVRIVATAPGRIADPWLVLRPVGVERSWMSPRDGMRADGRYDLPNVPAGKWEALACCSDSVIQKVVPIDVPASGVLDVGIIEVPGTMTLKGRVVTAEGTPAGGAELEYFDPAGFSMPNTGNGALAKADGTFEINVPLNARGELVVEKPGSGAVMLVLDGRGAFLEVRLGAACQLRVAVKPAPGKREATYAQLMRPGGLAQWSPEGLCDELADGSRVYQFEGIAPGKWMVHVGDEDGGDTHEVILSPDEPVNVTYVSPPR